MRASVLVGLVLILALAGTVGAQEKTEEKSSGNWFTNLWPFGGSRKKADPQPTPKKDVPPPIDQEALARARELAAMHRRQEVCRKLQEIALATRDEELLRKAEELSDRAFVLYLQRTGGLGSVGNIDEQILEQHLNSRGSTGRLTPANSAPVSGSANRAALREEGP